MALPVAKGSTIKDTMGSRIFDVLNYLVIAVAAFICLAPFLFVISASVSPLNDVLSRKFFLYPKVIDLSTYKYLLSTPSLIRSIGISFLVTAVGTVISMFMTITLAYPLSKKELSGRGIVNAMIVFTMLFSGGMIPTYLVVSGLGLTDSLLSLWLPGAVSAYNMILLRNSFSGIPAELEEAALIDGANYWTILWKIIAPLSLASIATFALFYAVGYWNSYFDAVLYIDSAERWPIQVWLRQIVIMSSGGFSDNSSVSDMGYIPPQNISYAVIVFATVPILVVYPFIQKYFTKGVMMGSVKG